MGKIDHYPDVPLRLFELVTDGRLRWRLPRGGDEASTPLVYSLTARERRATVRP
jgi:hypothetical protein